jgi:Ni/Fe-hydrogenase 1 B-type cytochrome subunit
MEQMLETITYNRHKVYDPLLRLIHLWNGITILFLIVTVWVSDLFEKGVGEKTLWQFHIYLGYALIIGVISRLVWGFVGPPHARFYDMWHPSVWWYAICNLKLTSEPRIGHNILASGAYLLVYLLLVAMAITGLSLAAIEHSMGPLNYWIGDMPWLKELFKEPHELIFYLLMSFVVIHIAALIWHEKKDKTPIAQSMVSGYQYEVVTSSNIQQNQGEKNA